MTLQEICNMLKRIEEQKQVTYPCAYCEGSGILLLESRKAVCMSCGTETKAHQVMIIKLFLEYSKMKKLH